MRFCRFGDGRLGLVEGDIVRDVTAALDVLPRYAYPLPQHDVFIANLDAVAARARVAREGRAGAAARSRDAAQPGGQSRARSSRRRSTIRSISTRCATTRSCTATIPGTRSRFRAPGCFSRRPARSSARGRASSFAAPKRRTDHEVELAFVIGRTASRVSRDEALSLRRRLRDRSRHHDPRHRGPQLPQVAGHVQRARPLAGDRRRDPRSRRARSADHGQRRAASEVEHEIHDSRRRRADRAGVVVLHAASGRSALHRHARRREPDRGRRSHRRDDRADRHDGGRRPRADEPRARRRR